MIKTNEVRRGNLINHADRFNKKGEVYSGLRGPFEIVQIAERSVYAKQSKGFDFSIFERDIEGIQLTPEVLEKLGFTYREHLKDRFLKFGKSGAIIIVQESGVSTPK